MTLLALLGCAPHLGRPAVSYGEAAPMPIVQPSTDARRWYLPMETDALGPVLWFVDTGYRYTTCDDGLVDALALRTRGHARVSGEVGTVHATKAALPDFALGGHTVSGLACQVRDLATTSSIGDPAEVPVAGVIGLDVLRRFRVVFAPERGTIELLDPRSAPPLAADEGTVAKLHGWGPGHRVRLPLAPDGARRTWTLVDTGATGTFVDGRRIGLAPTVAVDMVFAATGGSVARTLLEYATSGVTVGGLAAGPAMLVDRDRSRWQPGLLGIDLLSRFHQEYDFAHRRALLRPAPPLPLPRYEAWSAVASPGPSASLHGTPDAVSLLP